MTLVKVIHSEGDRGIRVYKAKKQPSEANRMIAQTGDPVFSDVSAGSGLSDNNLYAIPILVPAGSRCVGAAYMLQTAGNTTQDNENSIGLFGLTDLSDPDAGMTLRATTGDDGTIWEQTANVTNYRAFSATYTSTVEQIMWLGFLFNWSAAATPPVFWEFLGDGGNLQASRFGTNETSTIWGAWQVAGQNTMPTTRAWAGLSSGGHQILAGIYTT